MELICGGASSVVYGDSESPYESVFKSFANLWEKVNVQDYRTLGSSNRKLNAAAAENAELLLNWLQNSPNMREDYKKLIELSILFLGATFPANYNFTFLKSTWGFLSRMVDGKGDLYYHDCNV